MEPARRRPVGPSGRRDARPAATRTRHRASAGAAGESDQEMSEWQRRIPRNDGAGDQSSWKELHLPRAVHGDGWSRGRTERDPADGGGGVAAGYRAAELAAHASNSFSIRAACSPAALARSAYRATLG